MEKNFRKTSIFFLITILGFALLSASCKLKAEQKSLTSQFEMVDILIADNQFSDAVKQLKKIEKQTYDVWSYIGVYKRYAQIGEDKLSEKLLKKALKKNSRSIELKAIYANLLTRQNRFEEAKKFAEDLHGTKYGSVYSELVLKEAMTGETADFYKDPKYYSIYYDAYRGSLNPIWIRNCAVFKLKEGLFDAASSLLPASFADADDAYFWGLVLFDSGKYYEAIGALEASRSYLLDSAFVGGRRSGRTSEIKQIALESDAYMAVAEMESAEARRQELICQLDNFDRLSAEDENLLSIIVLNSAVWAKNQYDDDSCADLLFYSVNRWPDNVGALILYSDFAYNSNLERDESMEIKNLRANGISSVSMEKYDNRRRIPMSDAVYRLEQALERTKDPYLSIARLDLKYKTDKSFTIKDKTTDLWLQMENNYTEEEKYQMLLVQYVLSFLLKTNQKDDAKELFTKYISTAYNFDPKQDFWIQVQKNLSVMNERTAEFAAWFATDAKKFDEALRIYEYCVYESGGILYEGIVSPLVSTVSCMNLADIYFSTGKKDQALDLYGKAAGRESKKYLRSDVFYRIANIYAASGDKKNALRSAEYAILLYPDNARAALLKEKLSQSSIPQQQ